MIVARLSARVNATESGEKVRQAVLNLFPRAALDPSPDAVRGETNDLDALAKAIRSARVLDTARAVFLRGMTSDGLSTAFDLNKQAAFSGRLNFATVPGPLGDIQVMVVAGTPEELRAWIDAVAPDTRAAGYRRALGERELRGLLRSERGYGPEESGE